MNATKRKFNALIQGLGNRPSTSVKSTTSADDVSIVSSDPSRQSTSSTQSKSSSMAVDSDLLAKRRRLAALGNTTGNIASTAPGTATSNLSGIVLKKWAPQKSSNEPTQAAAPKYSPSDRNELLRRLSTFQEITDWTPKPERVSEIEWAKRGWVCHGKDRVRCLLCNKELVVKTNRREVDGKETLVAVGSEIGTQKALPQKQFDANGSMQKMP
jgi:hypothetical protein